MRISGSESRRSPLLPPLGQSGSALALAVMVAVFISLAIVASFWVVRFETKHTGKTIERFKAEYVAESALGWAVSTIAPTFMTATHDSTGESVAPDGDTTASCADTAHHRIAPSKLDERIDPMYASSSVSYNGDGWIVQATTDPDEALSGRSEEIISFKVFYPDSKTVRIEGYGEVEGVQAEVVMTAEVQSVMNYGMISNGDRVPYQRRTNGMVGDVYVNGDMYLNPVDGGNLKGASQIAATGRIILGEDIHRKYGQAKETFVNVHTSSAWRTNYTFPLGDAANGYDIEFERWHWNKDNYSVKIYYNENDYVWVNKDTDFDNPPSNIADIVKQGAPPIEIPNIRPKSPWLSNYTEPCDCRVYSVDYRDLPAYVSSGVDYYRDFLFNNHYGTFKKPAETHVGYHASNGSGHNYDGGATANNNVRTGNIEFGSYIVHSNTRESRRESEDLEEYLSAHGGWWRHRFAGGHHGGEWVPILWVDLSDTNFYPRQCPEGGIVDFQDENILLVNGDSLLYPVTIYTRGEIYVVGDYNVGHRIRNSGGTYNQIWDGDINHASTGIDARIADGGIKGTALVADSNRIWWLSPWFALGDHGLGTRSYPPTALRGRVNHDYRNEASAERKSWARSNVPGTTEENCGTFVGVFVSGCPMVDYGFFCTSLGHGCYELLGPYSWEGFGYTSEAQIVVGTEIFLNNGQLEADWNPDLNGGAGGYDDISPPSGYWLELRDSPHRTVTIDGTTYDRFLEWKGRDRACGYPPRPGYIPNRAGRGFASYGFYRDMRKIPPPPGIATVLRNKQIYKK